MPRNPDQLERIDRMASYVAKYGMAFEEEIKRRERGETVVACLDALVACQVATLSCALALCNNLQIIQISTSFFLVVAILRRRTTIGGGL